MGLALPAQPGFVVNENLDELAELTRSTGSVVVGRSLQYRKEPDGRTLIGRGKVSDGGGVGYGGGGGRFNRCGARF